MKKLRNLESDWYKPFAYRYCVLPGEVEHVPGLEGDVHAGLAHVGLAEIAAGVAGQFLRVCTRLVESPMFLALQLQDEHLHVVVVRREALCS